MYDLIIIGGGAAGLSAAVYAIDKQLNALLIAEELGGKAGTQQHLHGQAGEEYLAGAETVRLFGQRVAEHPDLVLRDRVVGVEQTRGTFHIETQRHGEQTSRAVLVATGATPLPLEVPGAKELLNHGIGYSATTHAHLLAGKPVAVIGATSRALRGVAELARIAAQIYLIVPEAGALTSPLARSLRRLPNVTVLEGYQVRELDGAASLEHAVIERDGEQSWLRVDAAFADVGLLPNSSAVRRIAKLDPEGFIEVDAGGRTSVPGLFAAGDVTTLPVEQLVIALGDGSRAATHAYDYILAHPVLYESEPAD